MKKILLLVLFTLSIKVFSQESKFSIELSYPFPIGDNFIGKNYDGIVDIGAKYRFLDFEPVSIGASVNGSLFINNSNLNEGSQDYKVTTYTVQPRVFAELYLETIQNLHPSMGLGYSFFIFDVSGYNSGMDISGASSTQNGFNLNAGLAYDITARFFAQIQYDFVKLSTEDGVPDGKYNTNISILKIGVGLRF